MNTSIIFDVIKLVDALKNGGLIFQDNINLQNPKNDKLNRNILRLNIPLKNRVRKMTQRPKLEKSSRLTPILREIKL